MPTGRIFKYPDRRIQTATVLGRRKIHPADHGGTPWRIFPADATGGRRQPLEQAPGRPHSEFCGKYPLTKDIYMIS